MTHATQPYSDDEMTRRETRASRRVKVLLNVYKARGLDSDTASDVAIEVAYAEQFGHYDVYYAWANSPAN